MLTKPLVCTPGRVNRVARVCRQRHGEAAREGGLPPDQMPPSLSMAVFTRVYERARDSEFRSDEMFPLVPGGVPSQRQQARINMNFRLPSAVPVERVAVIVFDPA